jgi:hypothetical protein
MMALAFAKGGVSASARISPSRRTTIETDVYFSQDGKSVMRTNYFNRVR